jgi:hypothetical protein
MKLIFSALLHCVVQWNYTQISDNSAAFIIRVEAFGSCKNLQNVGKILPLYRISQLRRQQSSWYISAVLVL